MIFYSSTRNIIFQILQPSWLEIRHFYGRFNSQEFASFAWKVFPTSNEKFHIFLCIHYLYKNVLSSTGKYESKMSAISWSEKNRTIKANASEEKNFIASHRMKLRWFDVYFHLGNITSGGRWKIWIAKSFSFFPSRFSSTSFSQFPFQFALTSKKIVHISLWRSTRICFSAFEINKIHVQPMRHV